MLIRLRARIAGGEAGFTLIELLVSISIGSIVMLALFAILDRAAPAQSRVSDRVQAQASGRTALEGISQQLRSAVCVQNASGGLLSPVVSAGDNQVSFYSYLPDRSTITNGAQVFTPSVIQLTYDPVAKTLTRKTWGPFTPPATPPDPNVDPPVTTRTILDSVTPTGTANTAVPSAFFGYYPYDSTTALTTAGMTATTRGTIARIALGFTVAPSGAGAYTPATTSFADDVTLRLPPQFLAGAAQGGPRCVV
jgi:prepilin-type N-terminal cleavage/methylation domain-containing protein